MPDLRRRGGRHPRHGHPRRARDWRGRRHGGRARRAARIRGRPRFAGGNHRRHPGPHPSHRGQSLLGDRPHEAPVCFPARPAHRGDPPPDDRGGPAGPRRGHRHQPRHRPQRRAAGAGPQDRSHPLQRGRARHRGLRHRAGRDPRGHRKRQAGGRLRRRDPARSCKARGSPSGSCSRTASPPRSSPTTWPATS